MAEDRRIIVEITSKIDLDVTTNNQPEEEELPGSRKHIQKFNNEKTIDHKARSMAKMYFNRAKEFTSNSSTSVINRYFSLSENYMAETDYNNLMTRIGKVNSLWATLKVGSSIGGPIGTVAAAAAWGTNEFISYQNRMSGYYQALNATNYQTQFDKSRLGLTNEGKGTENY